MDLKTGLLLVAAGPAWLGTWGPSSRPDMPHGAAARAAHAGRLDARKENHEAMSHARGTFDVKLTPQGTTDAGDGAPLDRRTIDKTFRGDLEGTSRGEMLAAATPTKGSAGYVAMERVTGTLAGRKGGFTLQHTATMNRGVPSLSITVVPDSGTGELAGLTGSMSIVIADGRHSYSFEYTLPD